jgi:chorismate--pyruvate lyase
VWSKQGAMVWRCFRRVPESALPRNRRAWVLDAGSLTKRLVKVSHGDFAVRVTFQGWGYPSRDEMKVLKVPVRQKALIREVELLCFGVVWVTARSVIPHSTLSGAEKQLQFMGNRPLGAFLFKARTMHRQPIEVSMPISKHLKGVYGRRSVFLLHDKPLLVSELFMPCVFETRAKSKIN